MTSLLRVERYSSEGSSLIRQSTHRDGSITESRVKVPSGRPSAAVFDSGSDADYDGAWLASEQRPEQTERHGAVRVVDVFAGCGGLTLGVEEACRALGFEMDARLAIDIDGEALSVYGQNFPTAEVQVRPVEELVQAVGTPGLSPTERRLVSDHADIDLLIGGPPCQGHSNLNNHTRWSDARNELYMSMARFCEILRPKHVIIENVQGVIKDDGAVAQRTWTRLRTLGYSVSTGVLDASHLGAAQSRRRSVTLASRMITPEVARAEAETATSLRPLSWAINDLAVDDSRGPFDTPATPNAVNSARIDYLFDHDVHDLPNEQRPACHRLKPHSYTPMYGRLRADRPAPTITTGFGSMGRGRFAHPSARRLITPHEAARIQGFPDFFSFGNANRSLLHKIIGNAVPPKMGYSLGMHLLR